MAQNPIASVRELDKNFGPTIALKKVNMDFYPGEIRGLIGENGSGKSTVTSILAGMQKATAGEMFYQDQPWNPSSMAEAQEKGVCMILQEANTIGGCTVAENIFSGSLKKFSKFGFLNYKLLNETAQKKLDSFGLSHIRSNALIDTLTFEDKKLIEIVRAVDDKTKILVVDETTTALSVDGRHMLYKIIHQLANDGKSVVFISHDMDEILNECDTLTVLRDGNIIGNIDREELATHTDPEKHDALVSKIRLMMVGRDIGNAYYREDYDSSHLPEVALEFENVSCGGLKNFNLKLHRGEIIGFGGLSDCGMRLVGRAGFGLEELFDGRVIRNGVEVKNPKTAIKLGIGYISKNRDTEALILPGSVGENIALPSYSKLAKCGILLPTPINRLVDNEINKLIEKLRAEGFEVEIFVPAPGFEGYTKAVKEYTDNYDLLLYIVNMATKSNQTVVRIEWAVPMGADCPIFCNDLPTVAVSLENPYHLIDMPRVKTYINTYGGSDEVLTSLVNKLTGRETFKGKNPVDPFCGKWDTRL